MATSGGKKACKDCDASVRGIRGLCLEHRAQVAESLLALCHEALGEVHEGGSNVGLADRLAAAIKMAEGR